MKLRVMASMIAFSALILPTAASAAVVCNEEGDCWRTTERYEYRPDFKVRVYADDWKWDEADSKKYRWRDPGKGRGYYKGGVWIDF